MYNNDSSFVFFSYNETSFRSSFSANAGFKPANFFGDSPEAFNIPGVLFGNTELESNSNTGITGFYGYRVDLDTIIQPGGNEL